MLLQQLEKLKLGQRVCIAGVDDVFLVMSSANGHAPARAFVERMTDLDPAEVGKWTMGEGTHPIQCFSVLRKGHQVRRLGEDEDRTMYVVSRVFDNVCAALSDCRMIDASNVESWELAE